MIDFTIWIVLLIALAGFIKGFTGFGLSLILISVLIELGIPPETFLPIIVPLFVTLDILLYIENRKHVTLNFKENFTLHSTTLITLFIGILLGTYLLTIAGTEILKLVFAITVLIIIFFLIEKVDKSNMKLPSERSNGFFGLGTGILTGLFTLNSVPTSLYLLYNQYSKEKYMGALVTFLMISNLLLVSVYLFKELFTLEGFIISMQLIGIVLVGFFLGSFIRRHVPTKHFKAIVILILALNSLKIIFDFITF